MTKTTLGMIYGAILSIAIISMPVSAQWWVTTTAYPSSGYYTTTGYPSSDYWLTTTQGYTTTTDSQTTTTVTDTPTTTERYTTTTVTETPTTTERYTTTTVTETPTMTERYTTTTVTETPTQTETTSTVTETPTMTETYSTSTITETPTQTVTTSTVTETPTMTETYSTSTITETPTQTDTISSDNGGWISTTTELESTSTGDNCAAYQAASCCSDASSPQCGQIGSYVNVGECCGASTTPETPTETPSTTTQPESTSTGDHCVAYQAASCCSDASSPQCSQIGSYVNVGECCGITTTPEPETTTPQPETTSTGDHCAAYKAASCCSDASSPQCGQIGSYVDVGECCGISTTPDPETTTPDPETTTPDPETTTPGTWCDYEPKDKCTCKIGVAIYEVNVCKDPNNPYYTDLFCNHVQPCYQAGMRWCWYKGQGQTDEDGSCISREEANKCRRGGQ